MKKQVLPALTFDDVLLVPRHSTVLPKETDVSTMLTRKIELKVPLISAAMDTVTESRLAIAMAQYGGIGIIHKNLSIDEQAAEVDKVKRSESGMITDPITLSPSHTIADAKKLMQQYRISGVPITQDGKKNSRLVGILTNRDLRFETDDSLPISERMTKSDLITVAVGTSLEEAKRRFHENRVEKLLVVDESGNLKGLITVKDAEKARSYPSACKDSLGRLRVGAAVSTGRQALERVEKLVSVNVDVIVVDTAHGHAQSVMDLVRELKIRYPNLELIAGNVATAAATRALIDLGADAVKVGIGAGSICTTRVVAGIGVPMITAIMNCSEEAAKDGIPIIADGGMRYSGDAVKALAAGADSTMMGGMFAGTEESPGEVVLYQGRQFKDYRGMGSIAAMRKGGGERYFQDEFDLDANAEKLVPEGVEGRVPLRGSVAAVIIQLIGGIRAGMGYTGCRTIKELQAETEFLQITAAGIKESHVHDVIITKEAPNYRQM